MWQGGSKRTFTANLILVTKKGTAVSLRAVKTYTGSGSLVPVILNFDASWSGVVNVIQLAD